jgi:glycosyltransferase involved in cell wall biosynthesis
MKNRICFIGAGLKGGGQERALTSMANYLAAEGHQISIINLFRTEQFYELHKTIRIFWPETQRQKHNRLVYACLILPYLRNTLKIVNPDVAFSFGEWFNPYVILSTRFLGIPIYVFDRMGPGIKFDPIIRKARRVLYRFADGIVVQTDTAKKILIEKIRTKKIFVIPNPVNVIDTDISVKKEQIVTVGRLSREKGHAILLRAFKLLSKEDWTLQIVGDGPERSNLVQEAQNLGIAGRVVFHGHQKDFRKILGESEIFVLPSLYEGFPNALIEAMSVPLPCISSDCIAGPSDIIQSGINGILVEPGNIESLAEALNVLTSDAELRKTLAAEGYKVRETLAWDKIYKKYLSLLVS